MTFPSPGWEFVLRAGMVYPIGCMFVFGSSCLSRPPTPPTAFCKQAQTNPSLKQYVLLRSRFLWAVGGGADGVWRGGSPDHPSLRIKCRVENLIIRALHRVPSPVMCSNNHARETELYNITFRRDNKICPPHETLNGFGSMTRSLHTWPTTQVGVGSNPRLPQWMRPASGMRTASPFFVFWSFSPPLLRPHLPGHRFYGGVFVVHVPQAVEAC